MNTPIQNDLLLCCSFCDSHSMIKVIDFGQVGLAGAFLKPENFKDEKTYPLKVCFCEDCFAFQVTDKIQANVMFKDYFYQSSSIKTLREHFQRYAHEITSRFLDSSSKVLEFGCNDGVLLKPIADLGISTIIGIDPATNVVETIKDRRINIINDFFNETSAIKVISEYGKMDMVIANNVYAHIPDIKGITKAIYEVLNDEGVFIFEAHYLGSVINEMQYDMIYHEHLYNYSLVSLTKHLNLYNLVLFDLEKINIHAGSIRYFICKKSSNRSTVISEKVNLLLEDEIKKGFNSKEIYLDFASKVSEQKNKLMQTLRKLKSEGKKIVGYGASGRANTIIQYCEIGDDILDYMIDDAPSKIGFYTPKSHFLIKPSSALNDPNPPDYVLIFAWSFFDEIVNKCNEYIKEGGSFIVPLPMVKILENKQIKTVI